MPYTVLLAFVGVTVGGVSSFLLYTPLTTFFDDIVAPIVNLPISAPIFLIVFLPLLLFHASLTIDLREIAQDAAPILTLAILAVFAAAAAIGFSLSLRRGPARGGLLLGTIVATTDPAAVVAIFREVGAPPRLTRLLKARACSTMPRPSCCSASSSRCWRAARSRRRRRRPALCRTVSRRAVVRRGRRTPVRHRLAAARRARAAPRSRCRSRCPTSCTWLPKRLLHISGVVAVVAAGLTAGAVARVRLRPGNWRYLERVWAQTRVLGEFADLRHRLDAGAEAARRAGTAPCWLLLIALAAALVSRAAVLFGVLPLLSALRLSQKVSGAYKLAITWGGLRGAVTLALALSVTEHDTSTRRSRISSRCWRPASCCSRCWSTG